MTVPWWKHVKTCFALNLFWYRLRLATTTYTHICTTLTNVHCTLLTANQKWHEIMPIQPNRPVAEQDFIFWLTQREWSKVRLAKAGEAAASKAQLMQLKLGQVFWVMDRRCFCWNPKRVDYEDSDSEFLLENWSFFGLGKWKVLNKWSECDWRETELE